jgi:hypothetical protein
MITRRKKQIKNQLISGFKKNIILGISVLVFLSLNILFSLQTISSGSKLASLESQEEKLNITNRELNAYLVDATSLIKADENSVKNGFIKPSQIFYIKGTEAVASKLQ